MLYCEYGDQRGPLFLNDLIFQHYYYFYHPDDRLKMHAAFKHLPIELTDLVLNELMRANDIDWINAVRVIHNRDRVLKELLSLPILIVLHEPAKK